MCLNVQQSRDLRYSYNLIGDNAGLKVTTTFYLSENVARKAAITDGACQVLERSHVAPYGERGGKAAEQVPASTATRTRSASPT